MEVQHHSFFISALETDEWLALRPSHYKPKENDLVDCVWNVMAHTQKPDFVFQRNGRVHLNRPGRQFSRLLATEVCASVVVMLDTPCSEVVWRVLATHYIRQFPLHFSSRASPCAIMFQLDSVPTEQNAGRATDPVWMSALTEKSFDSAKNQTTSCQLSGP